MAIKERYFTIDDQGSIIHLPKKPNGFAVIIIGDANHYVHQKKSLWNQHPERSKFISYFTNSGYTVFYSNLYGRHWGSNDACELLRRLYKFVMKTEILNKKVHIVAEGMGALVAVKVLARDHLPSRSLVFINPCLNLSSYFETEKKNKLFYKRFIKELTKAYHCSSVVIEAYLETIGKPFVKPALHTPVKILHCIQQTPYSLDEHVRPYEQLLKNHNIPVEVAIFLPDKCFSQLANPITSFLKENEIVL
ncbi:MAG: alpha/beta hydrolase [Bacillaceae bacterium]|nr:alpha/beta hydrolase [Bacillaceae bacterium]